MCEAERILAIRDGGRDKGERNKVRDLVKFDYG